MLVLRIAGVLICPDSLAGLGFKLFGNLAMFGVAAVALIGQLPGGLRTIFVAWTVIGYIMVGSRSKPIH